MKLPFTVHLDYPIDLGRGRYPRRNYWYGGSSRAVLRPAVLQAHIWLS